MTPLQPPRKHSMHSSLRVLAKYFQSSIYRQNNAPHPITVDSQVSTRRDIIQSHIKFIIAKVSTVNSPTTRRIVGKPPRYHCLV